MTSTRRELIGWVAAVGMIVVGIVILAVAMHQQTHFGWFAYAPLSDTTYSPDPFASIVALTIIGEALIGLGLLAVGFLSGLKFARRGRATGTTSTI